MEPYRISPNILSSFVICPRDAYYRIFENSDREETAYAEYLGKVIKNIKILFFKINKNYLPFLCDKLEGKANIITNASLESGDQSFENICLLKRKRHSRLGEFFYEPLLFSCSQKITQKERIEAACVGYILSGFQKVSPQKATIVLANGEIKSIKPNVKIEEILNNIKKFIKSKPVIPCRSTGEQCHICSFHKKCIAHAKHEDCLSLLGNMTIKQQQKIGKKGIFTINQMSYLYKPRRRSRHWGEKKPTHQFELQALAFRLEDELKYTW